MERDQSQSFCDILYTRYTYNNNIEVWYEKYIMHYITHYKHMVIVCKWENTEAGQRKTNSCYTTNYNGQLLWLNDL